MRPAVLLFAVVAAFAAAGCGAEIGDSCALNADCSTTDINRFCDSDSAGGYCTIRGCDSSTCPGEAVCVRFFTGSFANKTCDPGTEDVSTDMCTPDELCALEGHCVTRLSEVRYCMRKCSSGGDCRSDYECRDSDLMIEHGGEPVPSTGKRLCGPGQSPKANDCDEPQSFCAQAPTTTGS